MLPLANCWCLGLSKAERAFWTAISFVAFGALVYEWTLVISDFVDNPVRSNVFYREPKRMRFPSLLFCQRYYYLNESQIGGNQNDQPGQHVVKYMRIVTNPALDIAAITPGPNGGVFSSEQEQNRAQTDYLSYVSKFNNNPWAAFERVMLSCPELVRQCALGGRNVSSNLCCQMWAVRRLTPVGPCLAIQPPDQEIPSSSGSFQIDFELSSNTYNFAPNFGGFDLYFGDMRERPMIPALTLMDEDSYAVQLTATTYENTIDRDCNRRLESSFRQFDFLGMDHAMRCAAHAVKKSCQCDPIYKVQLDAVESEWKYRSGSVPGIDSGSNFQVHQGAYQFCDLNNILKCAAPMLNSTRDPSNFTRQTQRLLGSVPCDTRPPCVDNRYHFAVTEFREMVPLSNNYRSRLRLYYESFILTDIEQRQSCNFHDIVINIGGPLTFWFIAVHILIYLISAIKCCLSCGPSHTQVNGFRKNKINDIEVASASNSQNHTHNHQSKKRSILKIGVPGEANGDVEVK